MEPRQLIIAGAAALLLAWAILRRAGQAEAAPVADPGAPLDLAPAAQWHDESPEWQAIAATTEQAQVQTTAADANVRAFLAMIARAEATDREADPYRVCYGYRHTIRDLRDHPAITGEWKGERLPDSMCQAAGYAPGCVSTAAGRYQIIRPTWERARKALALQDFGPASQDAAAVWLLAQRGALELIRQGNITGAIAKAAPEWASLPGNTAGQPQRSTGDLIAAYTAAGGVLA